ncbi:MAG: GxxExxY protein [Chloroflexi bacterium]|nr:GxxExxY protein [Chloroflexota bacterium]
MKYKDLTEKIIGCSYRVYNTMGFGFLESVYEKCLLLELKKAGLQAQAQQPITVFYEDEIVGAFVVDIIVEDAIILELKSIRQIITAHEVQLVNYLTATHKDVGLLINFGEKRVEVKRKVRQLPKYSPERYSK